MAPRTTSSLLPPPGSDAPPAPVAGAPKGRTLVVAVGVGAGEPLAEADGDADAESEGDGEPLAEADGEPLAEADGDGSAGFVELIVKVLAEVS
jgi:hypothetical protein